MRQSLSTLETEIRVFLSIEPLLMIFVTAKVETAEATSAIHHTLSGDELKTYFLRYGTTRWELVEDALAILAEMYEDERCGECAYNLFMQRKLADFRRERGVKELTEAEAVKLFYSSMLSWQIQLDDDYHADIHIRDLMVLAFSEYSPKLKELFQTKLPRTSHQALKKIIKRCSYELKYDLLPSQDTDVWRPDIVANYIQNPLKERYSGAAGGKKRTSIPPHGPKRG
jgi:hypothetical protein